MKKYIVFALSILVLICSCACSKETKVETAESEKIVETTVETIPILNTVNKESENQTSFDPKNDFNYSGSDNYLKVICDEMVKMAKTNYGSDDVDFIFVPTPLVVKTDDSDKNDIKVFGDFWVYGYTMDGTIFTMKNGGSYPGCYHLKDEDGNISFVKFDVAEDGSGNYESLVKICEGDENLVKEIFDISDKDEDKTRAEFIKMYASDNGLSVSGYKDYGWPVVLFDDIDDAEFAYNFYKAYFDEVRQEDYLNDMPERLERLKSKYMTSSLIKEIDDKTKESGADAVISAQDVTDEMIDTLYADNYGKGEVVVHFDKSAEDEEPVNIRFKVTTSGGKKLIESLKSE